MSMPYAHQAIDSQRSQAPLSTLIDTLRDPAKIAFCVRHRLSASIAATMLRCRKSIVFCLIRS